MTERHEALAQTAEHIARQGEEQNIRIDKLIDRQDKLTPIVESLVQVAQFHQNGWTALEGRR